MRFHPSTRSTSFKECIFLFDLLRFSIPPLSGFKNKKSGLLIFRVLLSDSEFVSTQSCLCPASSSNTPCVHWCVVCLSPLAAVPLHRSTRTQWRYYLRGIRQTDRRFSGASRKDRLGRTLERETLIVAAAMLVVSLAPPRLRAG